MLVFWGLILFILLVLVHEWGHFKAARRNGVEVEEFGLFFPPRITTLTKKNGTEYTLNALPLGGFVKLKGENDADRRPGTFGASTFWVKTKILLAGVGMNLLTAFVMITILAWVGLPKLIDNQFTVSSDATLMQHDVLAALIETGSPADKAGVTQGDRLTAIGIADKTLSPINSPADLPKLTEKYAGKEVQLVYVRDDVERSAEIKLRSEDVVTKSKKTDKPVGYLGVTPTEYTLQRYTWSAPVVAAGTISQFTVLTFHGLGTAIASLFQGDTTKAREQVSGPVGVFAVLQQGTLFGFQFMLFVIAIISLSLAIMNILPIPALDGGRWFVLALFRILKKPLTKEREEAIHGAGFVFLMGLIVLITIVDVQRFY
jgi:regulator of sigma E protease